MSSVVEIVGYTHPVVAHSGELVECMVSTGNDRYSAGVIRLTGGEGPVPVGGPDDWSALPGLVQEYPRGSYMRAVLPEWPAWRGQGTLQCWFFPTLTGERQCLMSVLDGDTAWDLEIEGERLALCRVISGAPAATVVASPLRILPGRWYFAAACVDAGGQRCGLSVRAVASVGRTGPLLRTGWADITGIWAPPSLVMIAASAADAKPARHFNGKIDSPRLFSRCLSEADLAALAADADPSAVSGLAAAWCFDPVQGSNTGAVKDRGPMRADGDLVNLPALGVTGHNWTGAEVDFSRAPEQYRAAHFHDDDLVDCKWQPTLAFHVPSDLPSGVYGIDLESGEARDVVPFIVSASGSPRPRAPLAVLLPTFSYLAYANEHASWQNPIEGTGNLDRLAAAVSPSDRYVADQKLNSTYDRHSDGTGTAYSSWRRPVLNFRADYSMPLVLGPHQFPADMELLRWLDGENIAYEVVADDDLHRHGYAALTNFRAVVTGSHPEYWSPQMLAGLDDYLGTGGRLVYLGGNGFYWVTICPEGQTDIIEIRRGLSGTRVWESAPGEEHHAFTAERGGIWRNRGWPPQRLTGVGFTAQGFDVSLPYQWAISADHPTAGFVAAGIDTTRPLGTAGSVLGGAAGFEIDRADERLGTPPGAVLVARARGFSDAYQGVTEDFTTADSRQGGSVCELVRSDIVFMPTEAGGAVFSVGSIAWCGALGPNGGKNDVAKATRNVLDRFVDPEPFNRGVG
ncbi:MAG TPA: N,N-dimethylformamidase beta subunit family domain-containing protein [Acidimicrobiales bacterium]|nr:N,N-dimethylformamidase beta subunit family domain-containing protein [Acidimicrobiales bacterium]